MLFLVCHLGFVCLSVTFQLLYGCSVKSDSFVYEVALDGSLYASALMTFSSQGSSNVIRDAAGHEMPKCTYYGSPEALMTVRDACVTTIERPPWSSAQSWTGNRFPSIVIPRFSHQKPHVNRINRFSLSADHAPKIHVNERFCPASLRGLRLLSQLRLPRTEWHRPAVHARPCRIPAVARRHVSYASLQRRLVPVSRPRVSRDPRRRAVFQLGQFVPAPC